MKMLMTEGCCTGLLWKACRQVYRVGMRTHLVDVYNATDFFMLTLPLGGGVRWNIAIRFSVEELESRGYPMVKKGKIAFKS